MATEKLIFEKYFNGDNNFITPIVIGYTHKKFGSYTLIIEKSTGEFLDKDIYACTVLILNSINRTVNRIDLSKSFETINDLNKYIESIDASMVANARQYGEKKKY